jgi:hypothetical protein
LADVGTQYPGMREAEKKVERQMQMQMQMKKWVGGASG